MNFRRSQSKVWFGSGQPSVYDNFSSLPTYYQQAGKKSLQSISEQHEESLSPQRSNCSDTDELKRSILLWGNRKSPSFHSDKSQDSGFSDAENSPTLSSNKKNISSTVSSSEDETPGNSPSSTSRSIQTPPTVVRRPQQKQPIYEEIDSVKRLSFSAPSSPIVLEQSSEELQLKFDQSRTASNRSFKIKRSKVIARGSSRRSLNKSTSSSSENDKSYHNETVYFGVPTASSPFLAGECDDGEKSLQLNASSLSFAPSHSTPKRPQSLSLTSTTASEILENIANLLPRNRIYRNTVLNGHFASVQSWIDARQCDVSSEVMSTLQTKSIERLGGSRPKLTPVLAYKMIKSLQMKVSLLESEFRRVETATNNSTDVHECALMEAIHRLTDTMMDFIANQEPKRQLYSQSAKNYKQLAENFTSIREMTTDLKRLVVKIDVDDLAEYPILDDLQLIKRYLLITVRLIFNLLTSVIVDNIEHTHNELVLGSNIMHLVLLLTNEFANCDGFASLNDAYTSNSVVRVLLLICFESKSEWIRSLSLRTLSLVCKNEETLQQFGINSGFEILRDMLIEPARSELEIKETISCLASLTGPWQRTNESNSRDLRDYAEDFIERITKVVELYGRKHAQMLLICVACLNNLSRLDPAAAVYSLIAHQSIAHISRAYESHTHGEYTIFLLEQISSLLLNMSSNRKSHYHLTSRPNLNFILDVFNIAYDARLGDDGSSARVKAQQSVLRNVMRAMKQLEAQSSNHELDAILTKIRCRLTAMSANLSESFNISCNAKNVTKISIYSQETFF